MAKDVAASIRQRLLNLAKERGDDFNYVLKLFLIQRILYRLGISGYKDKYTLKGAMLFWGYGEKISTDPLKISIYWDMAPTISKN